MRTFPDDHIVRYTMAHDVPIVGLVRDRREERDLREMAIIAGTVLALPKPSRPRE